ncbi:MAG: hypothetical protein L6Q71_08855, partial [Planctomycetes bacterium]|nr:hypothetical protein [Planctomycetota bacterium]
MKGNPGNHGLTRKGRKACRVKDSIISNAVEHQPTTAVAGLPPIGAHSATDENTLNAFIINDYTPTKVSFGYTREPGGDYSPAIAKVRYNGESGSDSSIGFFERVADGWQLLEEPAGSLPLYREPEYVNGTEVAFVQNEDEADALANQGVPATSVMGGQRGAAQASFLRGRVAELTGKNVIVVHPPDKRGHSWAFAIGEILAEAEIVHTFVCMPAVAAINGDNWPSLVSAALKPEEFKRHILPKLADTAGVPEFYATRADGSSWVLQRAGAQRLNVRFERPDGTVIERARIDINSRKARHDLAKGIAMKISEDPESIDMELTNLFSASSTTAVLRELYRDNKPTGLQFVDLVNGMAYVRHDRDGTSENVLIAKFSAHIIQVQQFEDGVESVRHVTLEVTENDWSRRKVTVTWDEFESGAWIGKHLQAQSYVLPRLDDHARAAIQEFSGDAEYLVVYRHTGWREIDDNWYYLHAGGAISADGHTDHLAVALDGPLANYCLPAPLPRDKLAMLMPVIDALLDENIVYATGPLFAAAFRVVLGGVDFSLHLHGTTKSEIAAVILRFFGAGLDARELPSWSSTVNYLEALAFHSKDTLLVVDDFVCSGNTYDLQKLNANADRLLRAQGNRQARGRLNSNSSFMPSKPPRGLLISTGESIPPGHSLRARLFVVVLQRGWITSEQLTRLQEHGRSGAYAAIMASFIQWAASALIERQDELRTFVEQYRCKIGASHARTASNAASLVGGLEMFRRFLVDASVMSEAEANALFSLAERGVLQAAEAQEEHLEFSDPAERFPRLIATALESGRAHIASADGLAPKEVNDYFGNEAPLPMMCGYGRRDLGTQGDSVWVPNGTRIGHYDPVKDMLYLIPEASYAVASSIAAELGEPLNAQINALAKQMADKGILAMFDDGRT